MHHKNLVTQLILARFAQYKRTKSHDYRVFEKHADELFLLKTKMVIKKSGAWEHLQKSRKFLDFYDQYVDELKRFVPTPLETPCVPFVPTPHETPRKAPAVAVAVVPMTPADKAATMMATTDKKRFELQKQDSERALKIQEEQIEIQKKWTTIHQSAVDLAGKQQDTLGLQQTTIASQQDTINALVKQVLAVQLAQLTQPIMPSTKEETSKPSAVKKSNVGRRVRIVNLDDHNEKEGTVSSTDGRVKLDGTDKSFLPGKGNYVYLDE